MRSKKILSVFLALVFVMGVIVPAAVTPVGAAWADKVDEDGNPIINYFTKSYGSDADKLSDMTLKYTAQYHRKPGAHVPRCIFSLEDAVPRKKLLLPDHS